MPEPVTFPVDLVNLIIDVAGEAALEFSEARRNVSADDERRSLAEKEWKAARVRQWLDCVQNGTDFEDLYEDFLDNHCEDCGDNVNDGEGYDGKCGHHADCAELKRRRRSAA